jgi:phytoene dehydrogenase-like protein
MAPRYHAIVIGAGLNGLTAAAVLGAAGRRVLVLDGRGAPGGVARTATVAPGFNIEPVVELGWLSPAIERDLGLDRAGLEWLPPESSLAAIGAGADPLVISRDGRATVDAIGRRSARDAARWPGFAAKMARLAGFVGWLSHRPPPRVIGGGLRSLAGLAAVGRKARSLGRSDMTELARLLPLPVADLVDETFEQPVLKSMIAAGGLRHLHQGPRSAGTTFVLLYGAIGAAAGAFGMRPRVRGGAGALADALDRIARARGAVVRLDARVTAIRTTDERVTGVVLDTGEEIDASMVLSSADARSTLVDLVGPHALDPELVRSLRNVRSRGVVARVHLALDRLPEFPGLPADALGGPIAITPDLDGLERAYDDAKYGRTSSRPLLEVRVPSFADSSVAPAGKHVMSVSVQYAPYALRTGEWDRDARDRLADRVVALIGEHAPNLAGSVTHRETLTPLDLEREYSLPAGQVEHAELGLDQLLFMRPVPECSRYRTPVEGLFLCGAGQHPGRHVIGAAGWLAARAALEQA